MSRSTSLVYRGRSGESSDAVLWPGRYRRIGDEVSLESIGVDRATHPTRSVPQDGEAVTTIGEEAVDGHPVARAEVDGGTVDHDRRGVDLGSAGGAGSPGIGESLRHLQDHVRPWCHRRSA